ncbi:hypothetical protein WQE_15441 [Paraburkholderia hospita]|uniref:Uncharacterized protein n=1 Tax=Paraburkholderia hospita TaxID=169430 RepID=A0ABP2PRI8_9BURK|nr:hypothetical protein WQE_15441 [Paraburkholderia hospita]
MMAESIRIVAFHEVAEGAKAHELVKRLAHDFRNDVSEFVEDKNEDLMSLLASSVGLRGPKGTTSRTCQQAEKAVE